MAAKDCCSGQNRQRIIVACQLAAYSYYTNCKLHPHTVTFDLLKMGGVGGEGGWWNYNSVSELTLR